MKDLCYLWITWSSSVIFFTNSWSSSRQRLEDPRFWSIPFREGLSVDLRFLSSLACLDISLLSNVWCLEVSFLSRRSLLYVNSTLWGFPLVTWLSLAFQCFSISHFCLLSSFLCHRSCCSKSLSYLDSSSMILALKIVCMSLIFNLISSCSCFTFHRWLHLDLLDFTLVEYPTFWPRLLDAFMIVLSSDPHFLCLSLVYGVSLW